MRKKENNSSSRMLKQVASTALIATMLAPVSAHVAYAQEVDQTPVEPDARKVSVDESSTKTATRTEALMLHEEAAEELKTKTNLYNAEKLKSESSYQKLIEAQKLYEDAYNDADESITQAKSKALDSLNSANDALAQLERDKINAQHQLDDKDAELASSQAQLEQARSEYNEIENKIKAQGKTIEDYNASLQNIDKLEGEVSNLNEQVLQEKEALHKANYNLQIATNTKDAEANALADSKLELEECERARVNALNILEKAQEAYDESLKNTDMQDITKAKTVLDNAKIKYDEATNTLKSEQDNYESLLSSFNTSSETLKQLKSAKDAQVQHITNLNSSLKTAQDNLKKSKDVQSDLSSKLLEAQTSYAQLQKKLNQSKEAVDIKQKEVNLLKLQRDATKSKYDQALRQEAISKDVSHQLDDGAFAFYKHLGDQGCKDAQQALEILEKSNLHNSVERGNPLSATSYENMLKALDYIDEGNLIRTRPTNNLNKLKVSHSTMAIAMVNADWATHHINHSRQHMGTYYNGENAAWGNSKPYYNWYDVEKAYYDKAIANGEFDPDDYASFEKWGKLPGTNLDSSIRQKTNEEIVGHYMLLAEKFQAKYGDVYKPIHFITTGFGFSQLPIDRNLGNFNPLTHIQTFGSQYIVNGCGDTDCAIDGKKPECMELFTTDEYRKLLKQWHDGLDIKSVGNIDELKDDLSNREASLNDAENSLITLRNFNAANKNALTKAEIQVNKLKEEKAKADASYKELTNAIHGLDDSFEKAQEELSKISEKIKATDNKRGQSQRDLKASKARVDELTGTVKEAKNKLDEARASFSELKESHQRLIDNHKLLSFKLDDARSLAENATNSRDYAKISLKRIQDRMDAAQADYNKLQDQVMSAKEQYEKVSNDCSTAKDVLIKEKTKHNEIFDGFDKFVNAQDKLSVAQENLVLSQAALKSAQDELTKAGNTIDKAKDELAKVNDIKFRVDKIEFKGSETAPTSFVELDKKVDAIKLAQKNVDMIQKSYDEALESLKRAKSEHQAAFDNYVKANVELDSYTLNILSGANNTIKNGEALSFRIDIDPEGFKDAYIDGKPISPSDYVVKAGSTIITFTPSVSSTLSAGEHVFEAVYENGAFARTSFTVQKKTPVVYNDVLPFEGSSFIKVDDANEIKKPVENKSLESKKIEIVETKEDVRQKSQSLKKAQAQTPATSDQSYVVALISIIVGFIALCLGKREEESK